MTTREARSAPPRIRAAVDSDAEAVWRVHTGSIRGLCAGWYTEQEIAVWTGRLVACLLYTSPSPRDRQKSRMPSSA